MKKRTHVKFGYYLVLLILYITSVPIMAADSTTLTPTDDVTVGLDTGWIHGTGGANGTVHYSGGYYGVSCVYIKFDLSSIAPPVGYTTVINSATLKLYGCSDADGYYGANPFTESLFAITDNDWSESTISSSTVPSFGKVLYSWTFSEWSWNNVSNTALESFIQTQANSDEQEASLGLGAVISDWTNNRHNYYGTAENSVYIALDVNYTIAFTPVLFDYPVRNDFAPGLEAITPIPHPGHIWEANDPILVDLYDELYDANRVLGLLLPAQNYPLETLVGYSYSQDPCALATVLSYIPCLDFVFTDFEDPCLPWRDTKTQATIQIVRSNSDPDINSAYMGNYEDFAGVLDYSEHWQVDVNRADRDTFYSTSGLNIANPACYPYEYYSTHLRTSEDPNYGWGTNVAPNKRSALFWAPLEHFSVAKRNLPQGHLLIPWIHRFVEIRGSEYDAPIPTRGDVRALIQHLRLRGADGYYREGGILYQDMDNDGDEGAVSQWDTLIAWQCLDRVFEGPGEVTILNTDTNKLSGIEWSGVQKGSRIAILVSNLGNTSQRVNLPAISGLPDYSDYVAPGEHNLTIYETIIPSEDVCVGSDGKLTDALYTSWFEDSNAAGPSCYLKFNLSTIAPPDGIKNVIKSCTLSTYAPAVSGSLGTYRELLCKALSDDWSESSITWANRPTPSYLGWWDNSSTAGWLDVEFASLTSFIEEEANGDGIASLVFYDITGDRTSDQYQHYYARDESEDNCFRLVVEYEPRMSTLAPKIIDVDTTAVLMVSEDIETNDPCWPLRFKATFGTNYWHGDVVSYLKWDLSDLVPAAGYETIVHSVDAYCTTSNKVGATYSDAFYACPNDSWDFNTITWAGKPEQGSEILTTWPVPTAYSHPDIPTKDAWEAYVQQEANGDGVMSVCLEDVDANELDSGQWHQYYGDYDPNCYTLAKAMKLTVRCQFVGDFNSVAAPVQTSSPSPSNTATGVSPAVLLSWALASRAESYNVYIGTNQTNVTNAHQMSDEFICYVDEANSVPDILDASTTYYWRIDSVGVGGVTTGPVWSFTTSAADLTDGFETDFSKWTTDWERDTRFQHSRKFAAHGSGDTNDLISDEIDASAASSIDISFWYRERQIDDDDNVYLQLYNGTSYDNKLEFGNTSPEDTWHKYETTITDSNYFRSDFHIKFEGSAMDNADPNLTTDDEEIWIDDISIVVQ